MLAGFCEGEMHAGQNYVYTLVIPERLPRARVDRDPGVAFKFGAPGAVPKPLSLLARPWGPAPLLAQFQHQSHGAACSSSHVLHGGERWQLLGMLGGGDSLSIDRAREGVEKNNISSLPPQLHFRSFPGAPLSIA